jgi:8-oxo-dGTP pyrophosphatase MutT (NUDIX family)
MSSLVNMECVNCGKLGHSFRDCSEPILSYGVIAVKFIDNEPHYLLICRRDSLSYVEFLRGKYKLDNREYIQSLLSSMTAEERGRLLTTSFDRLWETLWNGQNTRQFRNEYEIAKRTFECLKNTGDTYGRILARYIEESTNTWSEPEWGFPKGRRTLHENGKTCALREFEEESGMRKQEVHLIECEPVVEEYVGSNGIRYKQSYFLGSCASATDAVLQTGNRVMRREVGNIGWFPFSTAYLKIRATNVEKRHMFALVHHRIMSENLRETLLNALEWTTS